MPGLLIFPHGETLLSDIPEALRLGPLPDGQLAIGAFGDTGADDPPRVLVAIPIGSGQWILGETDLGLLIKAVEAFVAVHGDPRHSERGM